MCKNTWCVYQHIAPNGKKYIGITQRNPEQRWQDGKGYKKQPYFYNAIQKYGWDTFIHQILLINLTQEQASLAEKLFIYYWKSNNRKFGYNLRSGGVNNSNHSYETRRKISQANKGRKFTKTHKENISKNHANVKKENHPLWGKHHSIKTREKISKNHSNVRGKNNPSYGKRGYKNKNSKEVVALDKNTEEIMMVFDSMNNAQRWTGINTGDISKCCQGKQNSAGGYKWRYTK